MPVRPRGRDMGRVLSTNHQKALAAVVNAAISKAVRDYKNINPEARSIGLIRNVATYRRRPKEFTGFRVRAVALFLAEPHMATATNAEVASRLSEGMPGYKAPPNVLTEKLTPTDKARIGAMFDQRSIVIDLKRANTTSKVKLALAALYSGEGASNQFRGDIAITEDAVIVCGKRHPIHINSGHARIHAGGAKLNVEGLKALLFPD